MDESPTAAIPNRSDPHGRVECCAIAALKKNRQRFVGILFFSYLSSCSAQSYTRIKRTNDGQALLERLVWRTTGFHVTHHPVHPECFFANNQKHDRQPDPRSIFESKQDNHDAKIMQKNTQKKQKKNTKNP